MARLNDESIETFMSITGVTRDVALEKLEEHNGDLNAAVNAHFGDGDRRTNRVTPVAAPPDALVTPVTAPQDDIMDLDAPVEFTNRRDPLFTNRRHPFSLLSESPMMNPFSILDPNFRRSFLGGESPFANHAPFVSQPREVREIPIEVKDSSDAPSHSSHGPRIEDVTGTEDALGPAVHGTVIVDDDDDDSIPAKPTSLAAQTTECRGGVSTATSREEHSRPRAPGFGGLSDYGNDIEEQMIQAAIEASKQEAQEASDPGPLPGQSHMEDDEYAEVVSLSLKMAEQERALREQIRKVEASEAGASEPRDVALGGIRAPNRRLQKGSTSIQDEAEDVDEQPLRRHNSRSTFSSSEDPAEEVRVTNGRPPPSMGQNDEANRPQQNAEAFSDEWGGISSLEHDEAVMLEAAMFGGLPEGARYRSAFAPHQFMQSEGPYLHSAPRPPSPSLQAQRLIREQQDDEYLAALAADREKELKAMEEAEAARKAALEEERIKAEESRRKLEEEQELERQLAAKEASLPQEPALDDENAITLLVRMPDGSRHGRRFLKSDQLQCLFNFIDIGRAVKPGTYRLVRPYPRHAFTEGESARTLNELGLTNKQEALFLELI